MQRRAFINELKVVVSCLWRSPYITGTVRLHLLSYFKDVSVVMPAADRPHVESVSVVEPNGYHHNVKYRTCCHQYVADLCYICDLLIDTYFIMWETLEDYGEYDAIRVKRIMRGWIHRISTWQISIRELGEVCKAYTAELLRQCADSEDGLPNRVSYGVLNARLRSLSPNLHWFFTPLKGIYEEWCRTGEVRCFRFLYQCGEYILRGKSISLDLVTQQKAEYLAFEEDLKAHHPQETALAELEAVAALCFREGDEDFLRSHLIPQHSAGAIANWSRGVSALAKHSMVKFPKKTLKVLPELAQFALFPSVDVQGVQPQASEIVNVPKNLLKDRLISKEEVSMQYAQHAVQHAFTKLFEEPGTIWHDHIDLSDAPANGRLAAIGSVTGDYASVDLSSASDSVSVFHIGRLPRAYRRILCAVRCAKTSFKGTIVPLLKYAPMGSATCFPTECMIFFMAALMAIVRYHRLSFKTLTRADLYRLAAQSRFRIYGDDIIIETRYVVHLYDVLDELKFIVNKRKSYTQRKVLTFRESCGYEYLNGTDVAPLRTARQRGRWLNRITQADQLSKIVEYHNLAASHCLRALMRVWRWRLAHTCIRLSLNRRMVYIPVLPHIPYVHIDDYVGGLQLITYGCPTNYHLWRGNLELCHSEYQRARYWGFAVRKAYDKQADQMEIRRLVEQGFSPAEPDACRWAEYWISTLKESERFKLRYHLADSKGLLTFDVWERYFANDSKEPIPAVLRSKYSVEMTPVYE